MTNAIVVLNAGSSSLKFSVYAVDGPLLKPVVKGQIEGIGTTPRFKAKDAQGATLAEASPPVANGKFGQPEAFAFLLQWLIQHYQGEMKVIGVGHRSAHRQTHQPRVRHVRADLY